MSSVSSVSLNVESMLSECYDCSVETVNIIRLVPRRPVPVPVSPVTSAALNAEEIARSQIAAAAGVVRHLLGHK